MGILNFDGGRHGRLGPDQFCDPNKLVDTMAALGRTAHVPALWLYAENDRCYGPDLARRMFDAGQEAPQRNCECCLPSAPTVAISSSEVRRQLGFLPSSLSSQGWLCPTASMPELQAQPTAPPVCRKVFINNLPSLPIRSRPKAARRSPGSRLPPTACALRTNARCTRTSRSFYWHCAEPSKMRRKPLGAPRERIAGRPADYASSNIPAPPEVPPQRECERQNPRR